MAILRREGYGDEQVAGMSFREWKGTLDSIFAHETPAIAPAASENEFAEIPF